MCPVRASLIWGDPCQHNWSNKCRAIASPQPTPAQNQTEYFKSDKVLSAGLCGPRCWWQQDYWDQAGTISSQSENSLHNRLEFGLDYKNIWSETNWNSIDYGSWEESINRKSWLEGYFSISTFMSEISGCSLPNIISLNNKIVHPPSTPFSLPW